jgi:sugar phosphate isomerase/epimerase
MFMGIHNHDNLSDPDAFSDEASLVKGLGFGPDIKATLDVRHFTAANGDCLGFMERHHARISSVHVGDRRKNNGRSAPFGEGDAPIIELLRMIRDNSWPIVALLEFEHGTLRTGVEETQLMFDYCKRALA